MNVPFLDLNAHHLPLRNKLSIAISQVIESCAFSDGPFLTGFEREFAAFCGTRFAVGVGSGTEALWLTLLALGIGAGDEVITAPASFMATAEAISFCGARPVFVDIDEQTYTLDPEHLQQAITPRTRAIIPVHLFGQMADMSSILQVASENGIPVIEDACQAHGALHKGGKAGAMGIAGCFSFYPGKNLDAFGQAGAVVTNDPEIESKIKVLRDHGQTRKDFHSQIGWNGRIDAIQAALLSLKLKHLDMANFRRRSHGWFYDELLDGADEIVTPFAPHWNQHVYHVYAVRLKDRDTVLRALSKKGISCAIHYPLPIHLQEAYRHLGHTRGEFPVAEKCFDEFLSLPMFPELTQEQIHYVSEELKSAVSASRRQECLV